jgi:hypothetical protein
MYLIRAAGLPTVSTIDGIPSADILGSWCGQVSSVDSGSHNCCIASQPGKWFSKRKCRLPINQGLYVGIYQSRGGTADGSIQAYGHGWIYKRVA